MAGETAEVAFLDPPYNVPVRSTGGRGQTRHPDFAFASGEMSRAEFVAFLEAALGNAARVSEPGAVHFVCMDWKHVRDLIEAGERVYGAYLNLITWVKTNAGQGGLYRNQHELIGVFRVGEEPHRDNVQMGRFGRNRSNVWTYAGANAFRAGRLDDLTDHPTVKPAQLVADALKDVSRRDALVLDTFVGSGTTILAGERVGRRVRAVEFEPRYAEIAIRRYEEATGREAVHLETGLTLAQLTERRLAEEQARAPSEQSMGPVATTPAAAVKPRVRERLSSPGS
ncbi:DNA-methyltransferase [Methylobacterium sp. P31]